MTVANTPDSVRFDGLLQQVFVTRFDQPDSSSDDGANLLRAADERLGLASAMANALVYRRQATKVQHPLRDVLLRRFVGDQRAVQERVGDALAVGDAQGA